MECIQSYDVCLFMFKIVEKMALMASTNVSVARQVFRTDDEEVSCTCASVCVSGCVCVVCP